MAAAAKVVEQRDSGLTPDLKHWIDRVIVPTLVEEFLDARRENPCPAVEQMAHSAASTSVSAEEVQE